MKKIILISLATASLLLAVDDRPLNTHTELSLVDATGNTENTSFAFEFKIDKNFGKHEWRAESNAYYAAEDGDSTKNKWLIEINYDYMLADKLSFNYLTGYKSDKFSGYDSQFYTGPGLGYKWVETAEHKLFVQGNTLYSIDEVENIPGSDDYFAIGAGFNYEWQIVENLKFKQDLKYRGDLEDMDKYFIDSKTAFESKISDMFSMGISYAINYANTPAEDKVSTDRTLLASLIIDY